MDRNIVKKIIGLGVTLVAVIFIYNTLKKAGLSATGSGVEGLYKIGACYKSEEFGVTYKIQSIFKGQTLGRIVRSEKYPSDEAYKEGSETHWSSDENSYNLTETQCP